MADFCALVKESVQAERRDKMLALRYFGMTEAQPRTPSASKARLQDPPVRIAEGAVPPDRWRQPPKVRAATTLAWALPSRCGWDSVGVPKGSMKVADFLKMTEDDRKVVR